MKKYYQKPGFNNKKQIIIKIKIKNWNERADRIEVLFCKNTNWKKKVVISEDTEL